MECILFQANQQQYLLPMIAVVEVTRLKKTQGAYFEWHDQKIPIINYDAEDLSSSDSKAKIMILKSWDAAARNQAFRGLIIAKDIAHIQIDASNISWGVKEKEVQITCPVQGVIKAELFCL